jgi:cell division protease FtsH
MSNEIALMIDSEIKSPIDGGHKRATQVLSENVDQLHRIAGALLEYETLTGDEIKQIASGEDINRPDAGETASTLPSSGTSIQKTRAPDGTVRESGAGWGVGLNDCCDARGPSCASGGVFSPSDGAGR